MNFEDLLQEPLIGIDVYVYQDKFLLKSHVKQRLQVGVGLSGMKHAGFGVPKEDTQPGLRLV